MNVIPSGGAPLAARFALMDGEVRLATSLDIAGVFTAPQPAPPREFYTLIGCRPEGELRVSLRGVGSEAAYVGSVSVAVDHGGVRSPSCRIFGEYCSCGISLTDVRVLGSRPSARYAELWDVDIDGYAYDHGDGLPEEYPPAREFVLDGTDGPLGTARELAGVYRDRPEPPSYPLTLAGCAPEPPLLANLGAPAHADHLHADLCALTADGVAVRLPYQANVCLADGVAHPCVLGGGLLDVAFPGALTYTLPSEARDIWDLWFAGGPTEPNGWASYPEPLRQQWAHAAGAHRRLRPAVRPAGAVHHLDGTHVTDVAGFYCALGEAIAGPGGYFGDDLYAVDEALCEATPFTLVWHDSAVAGARLANRATQRLIDLAYLVALLRSRGSAVELR